MHKLNLPMLSVFLIILSAVFFSCDTGGSDSNPPGAGTAPVITGFTFTSGSVTDSGSIAVGITDDGSAAAWMITESSAIPPADSSDWKAEKPSSYTLAAFGFTDLYAWAKNSSAQISTSNGPITAEYVAGPSAGDIIVTEIMANPNYVQDTAGEWFELYNTSDHDINLKYCSFSDNGTDSFTVETELKVPAGSFMLFAISTEHALPVPADYIWTDFLLSNSADEIIITSLSGIIIDSVPYSASEDGISSQLLPAYFDSVSNDDEGNWKSSTSSISGSTDLGTPGAANEDNIP